MLSFIILGIILIFLLIGILISVLIQESKEYFEKQRVSNVEYFEWLKALRRSREQELETLINSEEMSTQAEKKVAGEPNHWSRLDILAEAMQKELKAIDYALEKYK